MSKKKREKIASKNSQFDPKIHQLGRQGFGFQMKKGYKATQEELSGRNLPFSKDNVKR
tara:strand:+ start:492 stop:665 length:174 start_codon:yes stop_codon:yes gene_type:complete